MQHTPFNAEKCLEVLILNQKVGGSIPPLSTKHLEPGLAPGFFTPAKGRHWRGFAEVRISLIADIHRHWSPTVGRFPVE
ncbi:MAG: hypothetical protein RKP46_04735 [Candidatus Accumulibacter sp.]|uniref:hypothetical protein n=1 Tax=Accumulibacter sp. TaxID=2053492 RepID=UPI0028788659|nr:hypothetical protein [Accumulibacter sp.]MDS4013646.1 hypothetical protein [Accumulibacter sp.]